jgi:serine/threonine-protein kinase HipA
LAPRGAFAMTPLYDVLSAYPMLGKGAHQLSPFKVKLAMAVRGKNPHWKMRDVLPRHWIEAARRNGLGDAAATSMADILEKTPAVIAQVSAQLPPQFPAHVADSIFAGLQGAADRLDRALQP